MDGATGAPNSDQITSGGFSVSPLPQYSDGTSFPANFLSHETVVGYENDRPPTNDGADDVLIIVSLLEKAGLRCCILGGMALQYYGSERVRNVRVTRPEKHDHRRQIPWPGLVDLRTEGRGSKSGRATQRHAEMEIVTSCLFVSCFGSCHMLDLQ